jgi:hypothetical protein
MRVTALGKLVILLLVLGAAVGGWRAFQSKSAGGSGGLQLPFGGANNTVNNSNNNGNRNGGNAGNNSGNNNSGNNGASNVGGNTSSTGNGGGTTANSNEVLLVTNPSKKDWLLGQIDGFNAQNNGRYRIVTKLVATREAMHDILTGKLKPAIWAASSTVWPTRLTQVWQQKNGKALVDANDPASYRVFFRSPLVFLTSKQKAASLRPVLGGSQAWSNLRASNGKWKFAHSDPLTANSGMMTLGLVMANYADQTAQGDLNQVATSAKFRTFMQQMSRGLVYDLPAEAGTSALTKAFAKDPNRYDFITTYESNALEVAQANPQLAVIYPNPTVVSETVGALINGDWLSDTQREGAKAFLQYLGTEDALRQGLKSHFRPTQASGTLSLSNELSQMRGQGFQQSFSSIELPPYEALNSAAFQWRTYVARKPAQ